MAQRTRDPLKRQLAFWDSSALVPLCVRQSITPRVIALYKIYEAVVWWATPVEITSALARLLRMKQLGAEDWTKSHSLLSTLTESWFVVQPSDVLRARAMQLVDRYDLRAADALQLAAALAWREDMPQGSLFLTSDQRLREAAILSGFDGKQI
ncbi:MAG: PIN domain-containing protein [Candidatus Sulfotelmatobacter sp.]